MSSSAAQLLTFALYAMAAVLWALPLFFSSPPGVSHARSRRWMVAGLAVLVLLGLDRLFWFHHLVADQIRDMAHEQGWYHRRRKLQAILLAFTVVLLAGIWLFRSRLMRKVSAGSTSMPGLALMTLLAFCFVRAMSNHYVDRVFVHEIAGLRVHWLIEWVLLSTLMLTTAWCVRSSKHQPPLPVSNDIQGSYTDETER